MTIPEFLKAFKEKFDREKPEVGLLHGFRLRLGRNCACPIEFVAGIPSAWSCAGPKLGLKDDSIDSITYAADWQDMNNKLRKELLEIVGVK